MGYKFTLVLNREITDEESAILKNAGCADAIFGSDSLPTNAEIPVTKMDFDDTSSPSLAEAIQSGLDAVQKMPDLSVPGLTVPAQPAGPVAETGEVAEAGEPAQVLEGLVVEEPSAARKSRARKVTAKKPAARKPGAKKASTAAAGNGTASADDAMEPVEASASSS